jgi:hypothetical protein
MAQRGNRMIEEAILGFLNIESRPPTIEEMAAVLAGSIGTLSNAYNGCVYYRA